MAQATTQAVNGAKKVLTKKMNELQGEGGKASLSLDQIVDYAKENWKTILSELVAAGVTAYLTHNAKDKSLKN